MRPILKGIMALIIVSVILLVSDLQNRNKVKVMPSNPGQLSNRAMAGKQYTLGLCYFAPDASHDQLLTGLWKRMAELNFVLGKNLIVKEAHSNGEIGNISPILLNMDNLDLDLILATSTPCITAALSTVKKHPVAFTYCSDPIAAGVGKSYNDHARGITGIGSFPPVEKTVQFILEAIPGTTKIGTIYNNAEANSRSVLNLLNKVANNLKFELVALPVVNTSEVYQAAQVIISKGIDVMYISGDNTATQAFDAISGLCRKNAIPVVVNDAPLVEKGALAAIGPGWTGIGYHTGNLVARMLNGASPDTIPLENFGNEEIKVDLNRAKELGITIPVKYLASTAIVPTDKQYKIALVHYIDSPNSEDCEKGIRKCFADNKLTEGPDFTLKVLNAQGDMATLNSISGSIGSEKWDLVFALSTPTTQMLVKKLPGYKIVFTNVGDPQIAGLGKSFEDHLPNVCGISTMSDFEGMVKMVKHLHPGIKKIGTVFTPAEINSVSYKDHLEEAAKKEGLQLIAVPASSATDVLDAANSLVSQRIEAFCQISDNLVGSCSSAVLKVSINSKIPLYGFATNLIAQGAVAVCARDYEQAGYESGEMAMKVLSGIDPSTIPYKYVQKTDFLISNKNAKLYGIVVPESIHANFPIQQTDK